MKLKITIDAILEGIAPTKYFSQQGQFSGSLGIDPDMPLADGGVGMSGVLRPTAMTDFSGSEVTGVPLWFVTNPKTNDIYCYANDGKVHTITSSLAMGTALNSGDAMSAATGNGAEYYDNYVYFAKNADVARYGPMDGSPSLTQDYWTSTLSKTALADTAYPSINGVEMPNHVMLRHTDDKLYFADVVSNKGVLHFIKTTLSGDEGDTDDGSTYNALDLDYGQYITAIEGYGTDIAIAVMEGTDTTIKQKRAKLAFWDTTSASYSKITNIEFPDPLITAMKNVNGVLYVFSGGSGKGCRITRFAGGYTFQGVDYLEDVYPPLHGAVDHILERLTWGVGTTYPETSASVMTRGSKNSRIGMGLHNILKTSSSGANPWVTALKYVEHDMQAPQPIVGWDDDTAKGLDKLATTYGVSVFRSGMFRVGQEFQVQEVKIPLGAALASNMTITPKIYVDGESSNTALTAINSTNYSGRYVEEKGLTINGQTDFILELRWSGTVLCPVLLPIEIIVEVYGQKQ